MGLLLAEEEYDAEPVFPGINPCSPQTTNMHDNNSENARETFGLNLQGQMSNPSENTVLLPAGCSFSGASAATEQGSQIVHVNGGGLTPSSSYFPSHFDVEGGGKMELLHAYLIAVQKAYTRAILDPDQITAVELLRPSTNSAANIKLICMNGQVARFCTNPSGSRLIQRALDTATPDEILMLYEEIVPCARMLAIDVFANHAVQKLLEHGPQIYKRRFISKLMGHVLGLSVHMYGCRVIQKAFEVGDLDQKVAMTRQLRGKVRECSRHQYANHVIQKCIELVPARRIPFLFRSFCRKVAALSTSPYGCHVIQKALAFCESPEIYHALLAEIVEAVARLAPDPFGNYVVQHAVEHASPAARSVMVRQLAGRLVGLSYQRFASKVVEKCLHFGALEDRRLIAGEILGAGGGQRFDHVVDMMCHEHATFVIRKMVATAEEPQLGVLVEVARRSAAALVGHPHGRHVLAAVQGRIQRQVVFPVPAAAPPAPPSHHLSRDSSLLPACVDQAQQEAATEKGD